MTKIIGITVFVFGLIAIMATYEDLIPFYSDNQNEKVEVLWKQDMELLVKSNSLPKQFVEISEIVLYPLSQGTKKLIENISIPITKKETGKFKLEITLDDWKDIEGAKTEHGIMIQYNLINKESGNTVWELGRTLVLEATKS